MPAATRWNLPCERLTVRATLDASVHERGTVVIDASHPCPNRGRAMTIRDGFTRRSLSSALVLCLTCFVCASCATEGFECGKPTSYDSSVIYRCDVPGQFCVCSTNSCAALSPSCESGLVYVAKPFARSDLAEQCVPISDKPTAIDQTNTGSAVACNYQIPTTPSPQ